jgi:catechol 2,3-dioxygenase-like lactoylglutathione lyase family enzyme
MMTSTSPTWRGTASWTHLALHVQKLEPSIRFYEEFTALRVIQRHSDATSTGMNVVWLGDGDLTNRPTFVLVLLEGQPISPMGGLPQLPLGPMSHLGFALGSRAEVDEVAQRAKSIGILRLGPGYLNANAGYLCIIEDPDGHLIEFSHGQALGPRVVGDSGMRLQS